MLKRYLVVLLSVAIISSVNASADNPEAESLDMKDFPGITIGNGPDNLLNKVPPKKLGPADLYEFPPLNPGPDNMIRMAPLDLMRNHTTRKVTPDYIKPASSIGIIVTDGSRVKNVKNNWVCTAFCAADDVIATSAHCLAKAKGRSLPSLDGITFHLRSYVSNSSNPIVLFGRVES